MHYLGLDIGDGETAVALITEDSIIDPVMQPLGGTRSLLSVVGEAGGQILVGEEALLVPGLSALRARFKSRFLSAPEASDDVRRFASGLHGLLASHTDALSGDFRIAVGCPAGWNAMDRERYVAILRGVGFTGIYPVSEARAAFLYARHAHDLQVDAALLSQNALVIDIGSSTTDFAYITDGRETDIGSFGHVNLGGGLIESYLLDAAVDASPRRDAILTTFSEEPTWRHHLEITARRVKETYFRAAAAGVPRPCTTTAMIAYDEPIALPITLDEAGAERLLYGTPMAELSGQTFMEALEASLGRAVLSTQGAPAQLVLLTGGASRMPDIEIACQRVFPQAVVASSPEPEYAIAKGLAYAARIDSRLERFQADVQAFFDSGRVRAYVEDALDDLITPLTPALADVIIEEAVIPAVRAWREGQRGTLNDLEKTLAKKARQLLESADTTQRLAPIAAAWSEALIEKIQAELDAICDRHHIDRQAMSLGGVHTGAEVGDIRISLPGKSLSVMITLVTALVMASISGGGALAIIATGPLGLVIGAVIGAVAAGLGLLFGEQVYRSMNIPPLMRKAMPMWAYVRALRGEQQRKNIENSLRRTLADRDGAFARQLSEEISRDLNAQIAQLAQQVKMPVH